MFLLCVLLFTGCTNNLNNENQIEFKSDKEFILQIQEIIKEPCDFIEVTEETNENGYMIKNYKFLLTDRNVEFIAYQTINNYEPAFKEGEELNNGFVYNINYDDYFYKIRITKTDELIKLGENYNIIFGSDCKMIIIDDLNEKTLNNIYLFLIESQKICNFKAENIKGYREPFYISLKSSNLLEDEYIFLKNYNIISFNEEFKDVEEFIQDINEAYDKNAKY